MVDGSGDDYERALSFSRMVPPDLKSAKDFLLKAHDNGDARATYALATWSIYGNEVTEKDEKEGVNLLREIEDCCIAEAIFNLGFAYDTGRFVDQDDLKAFSLYMRAALLGDKEACNQVSQYYAEGRTVQHDLALAEAWRIRGEQDERLISPPYRVWLDKPGV